MACEKVIGNGRRSTYFSVVGEGETGLLVVDSGTGAESGAGAMMRGRRIVRGAEFVPLGKVGMGWREGSGQRTELLVKEELGSGGVTLVRRIVLFSEFVP